MSALELITLRMRQPYLTIEYLRRKAGQQQLEGWMQGWIDGSSDICVPISPYPVCRRARSKSCPVFGYWVYLRVFTVTTENRMSCGRVAKLPRKFYMLGVSEVLLPEEDNLPAEQCVPD